LYLPARQLLLKNRNDIGKVAVPDAVLHKPGPLTPEEFAVVREHPTTGERILAPVVCTTAITALGTNANNTFSYVGSQVGNTGGAGS
jgi:hypothetical protein